MDKKWILAIALLVFVASQQIPFAFAQNEQASQDLVVETLLEQTRIMKLQLVEQKEQNNLLQKQIQAQKQHNRLLSEQIRAQEKLFQEVDKQDDSQHDQQRNGKLGDLVDHLKQQTQQDRSLYNRIISELDSIEREIDESNRYLNRLSK